MTAAMAVPLQAAEMKVVSAKIREVAALTGLDHCLDERKPGRVLLLIFNFKQRKYDRENCNYGL